MLIIKDMLVAIAQVYQLATTIEHCAGVLPSIGKLQTTLHSVDNQWENIMSLGESIAESLQEAVNVSDPRDLQLGALQLRLKSAGNSISNVSSAVDDVAFMGYQLYLELNDVRGEVREAANTAKKQTLEQFCNLLLMRIAAEYHLATVPYDIFCDTDNTKTHPREHNMYRQHRGSLKTKDPESTGNFVDYYDSLHGALVKKLRSEGVVRVLNIYNQRHQHKLYLKIDGSAPHDHRNKQRNKQVVSKEETRRIQNKMQEGASNEKKYEGQLESLDTVGLHMAGIKAPDFTTIQAELDNIEHDIQALQDAVSEAKSTGEAYIILYAATVREDDKTVQRFMQQIQTFKQSWDTTRAALDKLGTEYAVESTTEGWIAGSGGI